MYIHTHKEKLQKVLGDITYFSSQLVYTQTHTHTLHILPNITQIKFNHWGEAERSSEYIYIVQNQHGTKRCLLTSSTHTKIQDSTSRVIHSHTHTHTHIYVQERV